MSFKFTGYVYDGAIYCEFCFEGDTASDDEVTVLASWSSNETDSPDHCTCCHRPIYSSLTGEGLKYVLTALCEYVSQPHAQRMEPDTNPDSYYVGLGKHGLYDDWADLAYEQTTLSDRLPRAIIDAYRELVRAEDGGKTPADELLKHERRLRRLGRLWSKINEGRP